MGSPATAVQVAVDNEGSYLHLLVEQKGGRLRNNQAFVQRTNGLVEPAKQAYTSLRGKLQHTYSAVMKGPASLFLSKLKSNGYSTNLGQVLKGAGAVPTVATIGIIGFEGLKLYQLWQEYAMDWLLPLEALTQMTIDIVTGKGLQDPSGYTPGDGGDEEVNVDADPECCGCFECFS